MGRVEKLEKMARDAGILDEDESVQEVTLAQHGITSQEGVWNKVKASAIMQPYALLATERKLYGVKRAQVGFKVKEQVLELPLEEAKLEKKGPHLKVGSRSVESWMWIFHLIQWNSGAKKLVAYVDSHRQA